MQALSFQSHFTAGKLELYQDKVACDFQMT